MSKIFELFGHQLTDTSEQAVHNRTNALCPFMQKKCDGGGNRHLSNINLVKKTELHQYFNELDSVASGVCSLQLHSRETPWIVCPRRLMYLSNNLNKTTNFQLASLNHLWNLASYQRPARIGVWPELRISHKLDNKQFTYTFDYVLMPLSRISQNHIENILGIGWSGIRRTLEKSGYTIVRRGNTEFVEDFPSEYPLIVEIMTSSTSGGNKTKRSTIPMAVEDALLKTSHLAPGINYRQVWARMVSQLIVKSEVSISWGGKTVWVLQDKLVDYISDTTALNIHLFLSEHTDEVNILSLAYQDDFENTDGVIELSEGKLYAGPISSNPQSSASFQDLIHAPLLPPISVLMSSVIKRYPKVVHSLDL
ncbi:MAG: hypothetical protein KDE48_18025 [Anaerolineales bacterium]|nr:hypothetical protein [Anaerolineales bacterium]